MKSYRIKLNFNSPLHIGVKDNEFNTISKIIHSDTLFSAIINAYNLLYGLKKTKEFLDYVVNNEDSLGISSAFFYYKDIYFYPRPLGFNFGLVEKGLDYKKIKKIEYVSEEYIKGDVKEPLVLGKFALDGDRKFDERELVFIEERPRISMDRITNETHIYNISNLRLLNDSGYWFYLNMDESIKDEVFSALKLLSDEGIGGERTYGCGFFDFEVTEVEPVKINEGNVYLLLSNFYPKEAPEFEKAISYKFYERSGFPYSIYGVNAREPLLRFISEGSVFNGKVNGKILDITPEDFRVHKIYKYGRAYLIPIKKEARD